MSTQKGIQPGASLFGDFKIKDNQDFQISLTGIYSNNRYDRSYTENGNTTATMIDEGIYSATASAIYNLRLKKKNSFGVQLYHFQTVSNSDCSGTYEQHQQLISGESLLFALYSHKFGDKFKLFLRPGISSLNYKLNGDKTHEYSLRLNTTLIYSLTEGSSIAWGINIGNSSPQISMLNDAEQDIDFLMVQRGNPDLETTKAYNTFFNYSTQVNDLGFYVTANYFFLKDNILEDFSIGGDKLVKSYNTDSDTHFVQGNASLSWRCSDNIRLKVGGTYMYDKLKGKENISKSTLSGSASINCFWRDFSLNAYVNTGMTTLSGISLVTYPWKYGLSLAWNQGGWSLEAGATNLFMKDVRLKTTMDTAAYRFASSVFDETDRQSGYVRVTYTIDFGRKVARDQNDVNRNINSAIMKVE